MPSKFLKDVICVSLLTFAIVVVFSNTIFFGAEISRIGTVAHRDTLFGQFAKGKVDRMDTSIYQEHGPNYYLTEKLIARGVLPFWNPYSGLGMDLWGDAQALAMSPITWISAPFTSTYNYNLTLLVSLLIGAWGAYGFARVLKLSSYAALFTALLVTFNPYGLYMIEWSRGHGPLASLTFLGFALLWRRGDFPAVILAALACAASVVSGHAVPVFYSIFLSTLLYICLSSMAPQNGRTLIHSLRNYILTGLFCFLFTAPLVVPFLMVVKNSDCFKADIPNIYYTVRASALLPSFLFPFHGAGSPYLGPAAILLVLSGFFLSSKNKMVMWSLSAVSIFTLAMMTRFGPFDWISSLPYLNWFMPIYALPYLCVLMSALVGYSFDALLEQKDLKKSVILIASFAVVVIAVPFIFQSFNVSPRFTRLNDWITDMTVNRFILVREIICILLTIGCVYAIHKVPVRFKTHAALSLIFINSVSTAFLIRGSLPSRPAFNYQAVSPIPFLAAEKQRTISMGRHVLVPNTSQIFSISNLLFFAPTYPVNTIPFLKASGITIEGVGQYAEKPLTKLIDIASVKYAIATEPVIGSDDEFPQSVDIGIQKKGVQYSPNLVLRAAGVKIDTANFDALGTLVWQLTGSREHHYAFRPLLVKSDGLTLWIGDQHSINTHQKNPHEETFSVSFTAVIPKYLKSTKKASEELCLILQVVDLDEGKILEPSGFEPDSKLASVPKALVIQRFDSSALADGSLAAKTTRHFKLVSETSPAMVRVYENTRALPPAYLVHKTILVKNISEACNNMLQSSFNPRETACVENPEALIKAGQDASYENESVAFERPDENSLLIKTQNKSNALLVVSETFFPGWTCTDNGSETPIYRVNGLMRGIKLSPGTHVLKMTYMPAGLKIGIILWILGVTVAVFSLMKFRRTK